MDTSECQNGISCSRTGNNTLHSVFFKIPYSYVVEISEQHKI